MAPKEEFAAHVEFHTSPDLEAVESKLDPIPGSKYEDTLGSKGEWQASVADARLANINEHETTVRKALRAYPYAAIWSLIVSMSIIMEGYDTNLIGNFYGYPAFARQFGDYHAATDSYQISGSWQLALGCGPTAGALVGATLNGYFVHHFGFRRVFMGALIAMNGFVFIDFFGKSVELQTVGQVMCG